MNEAAPPTHRSHWRIWIAIGLIIAAIAGLFLSGISRKHDRPALHISDELELRLEGMLTKENPNFDTMTFAATMYDELPAAMRKFFPKGSGERFEQMEVDDGDIYFFFTAAFQPEKRRGRSLDEAAERMNDYFNTHKRAMVRLKYGDGWYSGANGIGNWTTFRGNNLYSTNFSNVPLTLDSFELQLVTMPKRPEQVLHSVKLANPLYRQLTPLQTTQTLPQTITRDGISVTLHHLVAKTIERDRKTPRTDQQGNSDYPRLDEGQFLRAAGTLNDQYHGAAVISISEAGTSATAWDIPDDNGILFSYGQKAVPFNPMFHTKERLAGTGEGRILCSYNEDLDMLAQPVKVSVQLQKFRDFQPDEEQTISLAIPTSGTIAKSASALSFWNGPVTVELGNQAEFSPAFTKGSTAGYLTLVLNGTHKGVRIPTVVLEAPGGRKLNLNPYRYTDDYRAGSMALNFATVKGRGAKAPPIDLADYTTFTVTLRSPRKFVNTFDFIATPTDAQVPAAEAIQ